MKAYWKTFTVFVLSIAMGFGLSSFTAEAEENRTVNAEDLTMDQNGNKDMGAEVEGDSVNVDDSQLPDNEELFKDYANAVFFGSTNASDDDADYNLTEKAKTILSRLQTEVGKIASGESNSTDILLDCEDMNLAWTYAELGVDPSTGEGLEDAIDQKLSEEGIDITDKIFDCLLADTPYEMYWFDKSATGAFRWGYRWDYNETTSKVYISYFRFKFIVDPLYRGENLGDEDYVYTTDQSKTQAAENSASYAKEIVDMNKDKSDYAKLVNYRRAICDLVEYNNDAIDKSYDSTVSGDDPWQLIYVFDQDADTNVVCEGYSKAFQYLCNLTTFSSNKIKCISVDGKMLSVDEIDADTIGHMWNVIRMDDGKNYLVDVTNCDGDSIGADDKLFMVGTTEGSVDAGYTFTITDSEDNTYQEKYTYSTDMTSIYPESRLSLSDSNYVGSYSDEDKTEVHNHTYTRLYKKATPDQDGVDKTYCTKCQQVKSEYTLYRPENYVYNSSFVYTNGEIKPKIEISNRTGYVLQEGEDYTVKYSNNKNVTTSSNPATITITFGDIYTGTKVLTFSIKAKNVAELNSTISKTSYTYSGKECKPSVKLTYGTTTLVAGKDYKVSYSSGRKKIGKYTVKVTGIGNYTGSKTFSYTISPRSTSLKSVKAGKKKITVKWGKQKSQTSGYQIQYSKSKKFASANKLVTIKGNSKTSLVIKKLSKGKKYFVRVRTYKIVSGKKYYSAWSAIKSTKVK